MPPELTPTPAVAVRRLIESGQRGAASELVATMVLSMTGRAVDRVEIGNDEYSLNSVNGRVHFADDSVVFFKFHVEEGETDRVGEYYRATILHDAGLPVDVPLAVSTDPGHQIVLYEIRDVPRMIDVCLDAERQYGQRAELPADLRDARRELDRRIGDVLVETLRARDARDTGPAAVHQLFTNRMRTGDGDYPGGRLSDWYLSSSDWPELSSAKWELNGVRYQDSLATLIERSLVDLDPTQLGAGPLVTAHGDDHQGNVWIVAGDTGPQLRLFDPAFAGDDLPALLALAKSTFHNVFAHPLWLYHPSEFAEGGIEVQRSDDVITIVDSARGLSPMRQDILDSLTELSWIPLVRALADRGLLSSSWRQTIRSALFLSPFLVTNLLAELRTPATRLAGLAHAVMMGSEPESGEDAVTAMMNRIERAVTVAHEAL